MKNFALIIFLRLSFVAIAFVLFGLACGDYLQPTTIQEAYRPTIDYLLPLIWFISGALLVITVVANYQNHWPVSVVAGVLSCFLFGVAWFNQACPWYITTSLNWELSFRDDVWWGVFAGGFTKTQLFWAGMALLLFAIALSIYQGINTPDEEDEKIAKNPAFQTYETSDGED